MKTVRNSFRARPASTPTSMWVLIRSMAGLRVTLAIPACQTFMLKISEALAGTGALSYRLCLSVVVRADENSDIEFERVRNALINWRNSGRSSRGFLEIELETEESQSNALLQELMRVICKWDSQMYDFYRELKGAEVRIVSPSGRKIKKLGFAH